LPASNETELRPQDGAAAHRRRRGDVDHELRLGNHVVDVHRGQGLHALHEARLVRAELALGDRKEQRALPPPPPACDRRILLTVKADEPIARKAHK
jgi:hypothetical protein